MDRKSSLDEYLTSKEAAEKLGITNKSVQRHIVNGEISAVKRGGRYFIAREEIERFRPRVAGRPRASVPGWRFSPQDNPVVMTTIEVDLLEGISEAAFIEALEHIKRSDDHVFKGTIARYIVSDEKTPRRICFSFVWRQMAMPSSEAIEAQIGDLRTTLASVLDWEHAIYSNSRVWMHT